MQIDIGHRFGRYEIRSRLGAGAMGQVFRAYDPHLDRDVALKVITADCHHDASARERFAQEARAASALNHPNIVTIHDAGEQDGAPFIVMELLEGQTLRQLLGDPLPADHVLRVALQIVDALAAAHERHIVHRDLKPENIFITQHGTAKILDFGLARICETPTAGDGVTAAPTRLTMTRMFVGTPGYASPEALSGDDVDLRSDHFSFGVILYELACGAPAFRRQTAIATIAATLRDEPPAVATRRPDLPQAFAEVICRCLQKDPERRYRSAREIHEALRALAPSDTAPSPAVVRQRKPLPAPRMRIIGREEELARISSLIAKDGVRLLTLTGPGGGGKTRLALAAAERLLGHFRGQVLFVPLGTVTDPSNVINAIAAALGARPAAGHTTLDAVIADLNLTAAPTLIVLDNFEQVIDAASDLSALLAASPFITFVVTSREVLHLYGEYDLAVPPLPVQARDGDPSCGDGTDAPAIALFLERARAADPTFELTGESRKAVVEICRRLDGLPLALELAAARIRTLPPQALLARLQQRLQILVAGARDLPGRQQTMRRAIDWSYDLLAPAEQTIFRRLSVFAGPFSLEGAEAVCDPYARLEVPVIDGVASLVDKSLVQRQEGERGEGGFRMLETIREYALSVLAGSDDGEATRRAHAAYHLIVAEEGAGALAGLESADWLAQLSRAHDNFRAALDWLLAARHGDWGLRLALALFPFWERSEHLAEGRQQLDAFLALPVDDAILRARAFFASGVLATTQRDHAAGAELMRKSLELYQAREDSSGMAVAHNALGIALGELEELDSARSHLLQSLELWRQLGDQAGYARSLSNLASIHRKQCRYDEANRVYDEATSLFEAVGDRASAAWSLHHHGGVAIAQRLWDEGKMFNERALNIFRSAGDLWGIASTTADLGTIARDRGDDAARAMQLYREALDLFIRLRHHRGVARILESIAVLLTRSDPQRALTVASAAAALRRRLGVPAPITDQAALAQSVAQARQALDTVAAEEALRRGADMALSDVVRYAETVDHA